MKIGFIGAGNMGKAYIRALEENELYFVDKNPNTIEEIEKISNAKHVNEIKELVSISDVIIIAIKPQILDIILNELGKIDLSNKLIISLVAGIKIYHYRRKLGDKIKFVRVMPNTPALIKKGICGYTTYNLDGIDEISAKSILESTGKALKVEEDKLDIITAISGSGPAYVFLLINSIADAGVKLGLTKEESLLLASETFIGAGSMINETGIHPEQLKDMVTSPGGTTAVGLAMLEECKVRSSMIKTVEAVYNKVKEIGGKEV